jgi:hypothetical protein
MYLRGILWVFLRVLLVGFGLFGLGAARAPKLREDTYIYTSIVIYNIYNIAIVVRT